MSLNKCMIIGNLGRDPETHYTPNGSTVCTVSLATTNAWTDKQSGDRVEESEWHRVVFFGKQAEVVGQYLTKGRQLYIEGRIRTQKWQDKAGQTRYTTEILGQNFQFIGGGRGEERSGGGGGSGGEDMGAMVPPADDGIPSDFGGGPDDDIPF